MLSPPWLIHWGYDPWCWISFPEQQQGKDSCKGVVRHANTTDCSIYHCACHESTMLSVLSTSENHCLRYHVFMMRAAAGAGAKRFKCSQLQLSIATDQADTGAADGECHCCAHTVACVNDRTAIAHCTVSSYTPTTAQLQYHTDNLIKHQFAVSAGDVHHTARYCAHVQQGLLRGLLVLLNMQQE